MTNSIKISALLGLLIGLIGSVANSQTVSTPVVGFNKFNFSAGNTAFTATFTKPSVFSGVATSKSSTWLTVSTASFSSLGPVGGLPTHYVKITSGPLNGFVFDVVSNTGTTISVDGDLSTAGATPAFVVRPHVKVSDLFSSSSGLTDGLDTITVFNPDGTSSILLRAAADSSSGWVNPIDESVANAVIYPGQGFYITAATSGNFTSSGQVETTQTVVPLYAGAINLVSRASPSGSGVQLGSLGLGSGLSPALDTVEFVSNDGNLSSTAVYLWAGADGFVNAVDESPANQNVAGGEVMNVTVANSTRWIAPAPYTP